MAQTAPLLHTYALLPRLAPGSLFATELSRRGRVSQWPVGPPPSFTRNPLSPAQNAKVVAEATISRRRPMTIRTAPLLTWKKHSNIVTDWRCAVTKPKSSSASLHENNHNGSLARFDGFMTCNLSRASISSHFASKNVVKHGTIVSNLFAKEDLAGRFILCFDKTATLTLNKMVLRGDTPIYADGQHQAP
jgi:hypothetical protein